MYFVKNKNYVVNKDNANKTRVMMVDGLDIHQIHNNTWAGQGVANVIQFISRGEMCFKPTGRSGAGWGDVDYLTLTTLTRHAKPKGIPIAIILQ